MTDAGALSSVKVIEIAQGWAGPLAAAVFADFGADVTKIESIQRPDWWRGAAAGADDGMTHERSWFYNGINRNKQGMTLDLTSEAGRDILLKLIAEADVFVENFTAHVVQKLRITHDDLSAVNPRIISVSMPAYGSDTRWADLPALGTTVESMSGVQSLTGYEDGPPRMQSTSWDPVVGMHAAFALMAALNRRDVTGKGQHIEVSHIEAGTQLIASSIVEYQVTGKIPPRMGNASRSFAPQGCYPTAGDDTWMVLAAPDDAAWEALLFVLAENGEIDDAKYSTQAVRVDKHKELDAEIAALTATWDRTELIDRLQEVGVPAAMVATPADLMADPHLHERGFFVPLDREYVGTHLYPGPWIRMDRTPPVYDRPAPTMGQHNEAILGERLGMSTAEIEELTEKGVIGTRPQVQVAAYASKGQKDDE